MVFYGTGPTRAWKELHFKSQQVCGKDNIWHHYCFIREPQHSLSQTEHCAISLCRTLCHQNASGDTKCTIWCIKITNNPTHRCLPRLSRLLPHAQSKQPEKKDLSLSRRVLAVLCHRQQARQLHLHIRPASQCKLVTNAEYFHRMCRCEWYQSLTAHQHQKGHTVPRQM